jgi:galactose-1-phosphate uridylyltransferase
MIVTTLTDIQSKAKNYHQTKIKWHFHIMSPTCVFNKSDKFAFILEGPEATFVNYSNSAEKELGQELAPLLHGEKVLDTASTDSDYVPNPEVAHILSRAKELNNSSTSWHHHMLFPNCTFNQYKPKYALVLEDPETGELLKSLSDTEPTNDLKQIESLFYK